jgi:hypothetical protein
VAQQIAELFLSKPERRGDNTLGRSVDRGDELGPDWRRQSVLKEDFDDVPNGHERKSPRWDATGLVRQPMLTGGTLPVEGTQLTLGDIVDAVMHLTTDSREVAMVVGNLMATERIRFKYLERMSPDVQFGLNQRSGDAR